MLRFVVLSLVTAVAYLIGAVFFLFLGGYIIGDHISGQRETLTVILTFGALILIALALGGILPILLAVAVIRKKGQKYVWADNRLGRWLKRLNQEESIDFCTFYHTAVIQGWTAIILLAVAIVLVLGLSTGDMDTNPLSWKEWAAIAFAFIAIIALVQFVGKAIQALRLKRYVCPIVSSDE